MLDEKKAPQIETSKHLEKINNEINCSKNKIEKNTTTKDDLIVQTISVNTCKKVVKKTSPKKHDANKNHEHKIEKRPSVATLVGINVDGNH